MLELYVFSGPGKLEGEISEYITVEADICYFELSKMVLRVHYDASYLQLLKEGNIITTTKDPSFGYYIDHFSSVMEKGIKIIEVYAYSLNYFLDWRVIPKQQRFYGSLESVIKDFVNYNCIDTTNERKFNDMVLAADVGGFDSIESSATGSTVLEHCFKICKEYGTSINVLMNHEDETYEFHVWQGIDRSASQTVNPWVMFSTEFDNVLTFEYFHSRLDMRNAFFVAGEGEGMDRTVLEGGTNTGFDRREHYVDARDLQSEYQDENGNTVTLTTQEYEQALLDRGNEQLSEFKSIESYESTIDDVQYKIGTDYWVGDIVTFYDSDLNITKDVRLQSVKVVSDRSGIRYEPSFGTGIPTILKGGK